MFIAYPLQYPLRERTSMLRDTYIACPVNAMAGGAYRPIHT